MKVDTMRWVDKYAGVPLCAAGTLIKKLFASKSPQRPKNILFIELSEMGSAILADPAMRKAKSIFGAELFFLIFKKNRPSLELLKTVPQENIFSINAANFSSLTIDTFKFFKWARKRKIDTAVDLELFSRYTALLAGFSGAVNIAGFDNFYSEGLYRGNMITRKVLYNPHMHITKNFIALVNSLSEKPGVVPYSKIKVEDEETRLSKAFIDKEKVYKTEERIKKLFPSYEKGRRIVLINPNASELLPQRRWPMDRYAELIKMVLARYSDVLILITGSFSEKREAEKLAAAARNERCVNFAGALGLSELTALYSLSALMVSNDSGPAHFASVTDMPTIVIFGPETPALYGSLGDTTPVYAGLACSPCVSAANHRKTPCRDNLCLQYISAAMVFREVEKRLDNGG